MCVCVCVCACVRACVCVCRGFLVPQDQGGTLGRRDPWVHEETRGRLVTKETLEIREALV